MNKEIELWERVPGLIIDNEDRKEYQNKRSKTDPEGSSITKNKR